MQDSHQTVLSLANWVCQIYLEYRYPFLLLWLYQLILSQALLCVPSASFFLVPFVWLTLLMVQILHLLCTPILKIWSVKAILLIVYIIPLTPAACSKLFLLHRQVHLLCLCTVLPKWFSFYNFGWWLIVIVRIHVLVMRSVVTEEKPAPEIFETAQAWFCTLLVSKQGVLVRYPFPCQPCSFAILPAFQTSPDWHLQKAIATASGDGAPPIAPHQCLHCGDSMKVGE